MFKERKAGIQEVLDRVEEICEIFFEKKYHCTKCGLRWKEHTRQDYSSSKVCRSCDYVLDRVPSCQDEVNLYKELEKLEANNEFVKLEDDDLEGLSSNVEYDETSVFGDFVTIHIDDLQPMKSTDGFKQQSIHRFLCLRHTT